MFSCELGIMDADTALPEKRGLQISCQSRTGNEARSLTHSLTLSYPSLSVVLYVLACKRRRL